jgi:transcriptional regulator with XRE-family HTH domain
MGGHSLRSWREKLGLTMRDIETSSEQIARKRSNEEYFIPISRLSDFETKGVIPSIYRLYSLAVIYHKDMRELLAWYGVDLNIPISDLELSSPPKSHLSDALANTRAVRIPVRLDPVRPTQNAELWANGRTMGHSSADVPGAVFKGRFHVRIRWQ